MCCKTSLRVSRPSSKASSTVRMAISCPRAATHFCAACGEAKKWMWWQNVIQISYRFQPILSRLWDHDGDGGAFGLVARHALRRDGQPDDLSGDRALGRNLGGLLEYHGEKQGVPCAPCGKPYAIDGKAGGMLIL